MNATTFDVPRFQQTAWYPYALVLTLLVALPTLAMWRYIVWSGDLVMQGIAQSVRTGVQPETIDMLPTWSLIHSVGVYGPLLLMAAISWPVWKNTRHGCVHVAFAAAARVLLGGIWGYLLIA